MRLTAADIKVREDAALLAGGNLLLTTVDTFHEKRSSIEDGTREEWWGESRGSHLRVGGDFAMTSMGGIYNQAGQIEAGGDLTVTAVTGIVIDQAINGHGTVDQTETSKHSGMLKSTRTTMNSHKELEVAAGLLRAGEALKVNSLLGDIVLKGTVLESGGATTLNAAGQVQFLIGKGMIVDETSSYYENLFKWESTKEASSIETAQEVTVAALGGFNVDAQGGIKVELEKTAEEAPFARMGSPFGNMQRRGTWGGEVVEHADQKGGEAFRKTVGELSEKPGLEWMKQALSRSDVDWNAVGMAQTRFYEEHKGISQELAAVIALAVAVATSGWGTNLAGAMEISNVVVVAGMNAGVTALASQAAVSLVANGGDLDATLKALGSDESIRALATSMLTAGLTQGAQGAFGIGAQATNISQRIAQTVINATVQAGVSTAINGGEFDNLFGAALQSGAISMIGAELAGEIGDAARDGDIDHATQLIAHAALGCAMGEGLKDGGCASGAIGGVVGELTAEAYLDQVKRGITDGFTAEQIQGLQAQGVNISRLTAGIAAFAAGGNVNVAAATGGNAAQNNVLERIWNDPVRRGEHSDVAVTLDEFLEHIKGASLSDLQHEADGETLRSDISAGGPAENFRYIINPNNPSEVIDMRHFLVIGPQGEAAGLAVETLQGLSNDPNTRNSAFSSQDFLSNYLGEQFFSNYDSTLPLSSQLNEFFSGQKNE
jgi:hypothetical protein